MRIDGLEKFEKQNDIMTPEAKFGSTVYILFSINFFFQNFLTKQVCEGMTRTDKKGCV